MNYILVIAGGGAGSGLRFLIQQFIGKHNGINFPFATFTVNMIGCLLIGVLSALALKFRWTEQTVLLVMTGLLGGFTTFSGFSMEFFNLMKNNQSTTAFLYMGLSNCAGIALCLSGYYLMKP